MISRTKRGKETEVKNDSPSGFERQVCPSWSSRILGRSAMSLRLALRIQQAGGFRCSGLHKSVCLLCAECTMKESSSCELSFDPLEGVFCFVLFLYLVIPISQKRKLRFRKFQSSG